MQMELYALVNVVLEFSKALLPNQMTFLQISF